MIKNGQIVGLVAVSILIVGAIAYLNMHKTGPSTLATKTMEAVDVSPAMPEVAPDSMNSASSTMSAESAQQRVADKARRYERAKEIVAPSGFVNTDGKPVTLSQYVGKKVILLDIMTYSCINCIRTFPYLVDWYKKYEDKGLVIIGIHTPEFDFEKNIDNVRTAMAKYGIKFPVVLDNDYGTWNAYNNHYWPVKYLIDIDGFVRSSHIGEGAYAETEDQIQELLKERAEVLGAKIDVDVPVTAGSIEKGSVGQSPETYFGASRNQYFGNGTPGSAGSSSYTVPSQVSSNQFYLGGDWDITADYAENAAAPAKIVYKFAAKHVYLVASADKPVKVNVTVDGKPLGKAMGADVSESGGVDAFTVQGSRLYDVYSGDEFDVHTIELSPQSPGLKAFTFTFGN